jgi:hypothetical protein
VGLVAVVIAFLVGRFLRKVEPMPRLQFDVELPDTLADELQTAAQERNMSPQNFAAQTLEVEMATRILERTTAGRCGPRVKGTY